MAITMVMQFVGIGVDKYRAIMKEMGLDVPNAKWPAGIISHVANTTADGFLVVDVWESEADFGKFRETRLGPAFAKVGGMPEPRVTVGKLEGSYPPR